MSAHLLALVSFHTSFAYLVLSWFELRERDKATKDKIAEEADPQTVTCSG